jgi:hypothetical protein
MRILGEVSLDQDGVLHGWCWSPDRPGERRAVDIVIDQQIAVTLIASRFREDLRFRKFGDGYHGFTVTLAKQIANATHRSVISAQDHASGITFWQKRFGEFSIPTEFETRAAALRGTLGALAQTQGLGPDPAQAKSTRFAAALGRLGAKLTRPAAEPATRQVILPNPSQPALSIILEAGTDAAACLEHLRLGASAFHQAGAEIIMTDDGANPAITQAQNLAQNLKFLSTPGQSNAARRNSAAATARAGTIAFLGPAPPGAATALTTLARDTREAILISAALANAAHRIAPSLIGTPPTLATPTWPGLHLALQTHHLQTLGPLDPTIDDGTNLDLLDLILRAAQANTPLAIATTPHQTPAKPPQITNIEAGHRFAERWVMGWDWDK